MTHTRNLWHILISIFVCTLFFFIPAIVFNALNDLVFYEQKDLRAGIQIIANTDRPLCSVWMEKSEASLQLLRCFLDPCYLAIGRMRSHTFIRWLGSLSIRHKYAEHKSTPVIQTLCFTRYYTRLTHFGKFKKKKK